MRKEADEINKLLEQLLETHKQIDSMQDQLKVMEERLETVHFNIIRVMNCLAGKLSELKEASVQ